jgi:hypothetical protein
VLLLPSLVYVILSSGDHAFNARPIFGPKSLDTSGDTIFYQVSETSFKSCLGDEINLNQYREKITIISFYNPKDSLASSRVNGQVLSLDDRFRDNTDVYFLTLGFYSDSLQKYRVCEASNKFTHTAGKKWDWVLLGSNEAANFAKSSLFIEKSDSIPEPFYNHVVLLDKKHRIRSYRDGKQYVEIKALVDDIKVVKAEDFISYKRDNNEGK